VTGVSLATFYLICFVVGLAFSVLSLLSSFGGLHLPAKWHLPHVHGGHAGVHPVHAPVHGSPVTFSHGAATAHHGGASGTYVSFFNFASLMAFLAWFGGTGYLLTRYSNLVALAALGLAGVSGLAAAGIVFLFLAKVLLAHETQLDPADFDLVGMLGKVNVTIRSGGTGEIVFSQAGTRHAAGARSEAGTAIPKGTEVVITRYERGIAYVRSWEEMAGERMESTQVRKTT
jgi:membrane protein implicated in regulation of membrane protease activity